MHIPVLERELISFLDPRPDDNFIDCTLGEGGHAENLLLRTALPGKLRQGGKFVGIEWDSQLAAIAAKRLQKYGKRVQVINDSYINLRSISAVKELGLVKGIYFDLGSCLWHYKASGRGFSFDADEPLDMRFNLKSALDAFTVINRWKKEDIKNILAGYGDVEEAEIIAKAVILQRRKKPIVSTKELMAIIKQALPKRLLRQSKSVIRKVFQALRIAVNRELENVAQGLQEAWRLLPPGGKLAVITYHSIEDKEVKRFLEAQPDATLPSKKPITPTFLEIRFNRSARSAKLRLAEKHTS